VVNTRKEKTLKNIMMTAHAQVMAALHEREFRHMNQLASYIMFTGSWVSKIVMELEKHGLVETELYHQPGTTEHYKFKRITLTRKGKELGRACYKLSKAIGDVGGEE